MQRGGGAQVVRDWSLRTGRLKNGRGGGQVKLTPTKRGWGEKSLE